MLNDRIGIGLFFAVGVILLSPTIIGALLMYLLSLVHAYQLSSKLR